MTVARAAAPPVASPQNSRVFPSVGAQSVDGRSDADSGAERREGTARAIRLPCKAHAPTVVDEPVTEIGPLLRRQQASDVLLDLIGLVGAREREPVRQPFHVRVDEDRRLPNAVPSTTLAVLRPTPCKRREVLDRLRNSTSEATRRSPRGGTDRLRLLNVEPGLSDQPLDSRLGRVRQARSVGKLLEERRVSPGSPSCRCTAPTGWSRPAAPTGCESRAHRSRRGRFLAGRAAIRARPMLARLRRSRAGMVWASPWRAVTRDASSAISGSSRPSRYSRDSMLPASPGSTRAAPPSVLPSLRGRASSAVGGLQRDLRCVGATRPRCDTPSRGTAANEASARMSGTPGSRGSYDDGVRAGQIEQVLPCGSRTDGASDRRLPRSAAPRSRPPGSGSDSLPDRARTRMPNLARSRSSDAVDHLDRHASVGGQLPSAERDQARGTLEELVLARDLRRRLGPRAGDERPKAGERRDHVSLGRAAPRENRS